MGSDIIYVKLSHIIACKYSLTSILETSSIMIFLLIPIAMSIVTASPPTITVRRGAGGTLVIPAFMEDENGSQFSESLFFALDGSESESFAFNARICPPFVKCLKSSISGPLKLKALNAAHVSNVTEYVDIGTHHFQRVGYMGSLVETAGTLGIGPRSSLARKYRIKFQSESPSKIELVPHDISIPCGAGCTSIPISETSNRYEMPQGSSIKFSPVSGTSYSTPSTIPIVFDPTIEYSIFPYHILDDIMEFITISPGNRIGMISTNQLIIPSQAQFVPSFNLNLPNGTSIALTDGIAKRISHLALRGLQGSSGILTDFVFVNDATEIVIGRSILKNSIKSIVFDGPANLVVLQHTGSESAKRPMDKIEDYSSNHPAVAGLNFAFSRDSIAPLPKSSSPLVFARPHIGSDVLAQNKYFLHTFAPVKMIYEDMEVLGYVLECVDFIQPDFEGPEIHTFPFLFQFHPESDGGVVTVDTRSQYIIFPIIAASSDNPGPKFTIEFVKTEAQILLVLLPQP